MSIPKSYRTKSEEIRTIRKATAEERDAILADWQVRFLAAAEVSAALYKRFPPEFITALLARLPADAQARFAAEFEPRPVRRVEKVRMTRPTKKP